MKKALHSIWSSIPLLLILAVGALPFLSSLDYWPLTAEMPRWFANSSPRNADWADWVLRSDHLGWYRPVTAFSFAVTQMVVGMDPFTFRLFDLILHLGAACLSMALLRWLVPGVRRPAEWLLLFVFVAHPVCDEVVPFLGRRGFSLALFFGLAALSISARELRTLPKDRTPAGVWVNAVLCGLLAVAALFSHEGAAILIGLMPVVAAHVARERGLQPRSWAGPAVLVAVFVVAALAWRQTVLGGIGGSTLAPESASSPGGGLLGSASGLLGLTALARNCGRAGELLGWLVIAAAVFLVVRALVFALRGFADSRERGIFLLGAWTLAALLVAALLGTGAERHAYFALVPFALLLTVVIAGPRDEDTPFGAVQFFSRVSGLLVVFAFVVSSPVLHGQDPGRRWPERNAVTSNLLGALDEMRHPPLVLVAIPDLSSDPLFASPGQPASAPASARQPILWANLMLAERNIELLDVVYYPVEAGGSAFQIDSPRRHTAFVAEEGLEYLLRTDEGFQYMGPDSERRVELLPIRFPPERGIYGLFAAVETARLRLVRIPIRHKAGHGVQYLAPEVVEALPDPPSD